MTKLQIVNTGLILVGNRALQSLNEDTDSSRLVAQLWEQVEETVLREGVFTSATKRSELTLLPAVPDFQYTLQYQQPADAIRILDIYDGMSYDPYLEWRLEGSVILANQTPLFVRYAYKPEDHRQYDSLLCRSISLRLAADIAYNETEKATLVDRLEKDYEKSLAKSTSVDAIQNQERYGFEETSWLDSRFNLRA